MSAFVADPYEIGLVAALVKRIPEENQPPAVRQLDLMRVAEMLARENIASVRARYPEDYAAGRPDGIGRPGWLLLDKDVIQLAGDAARAFANAMHGDNPQLIVQPRVAEELARYLQYQSCEHGGWEKSDANAALSALRGFSRTAGVDVREAIVRISHPEWGIRDEKMSELKAKILPKEIMRCREAAQREYIRLEPASAQRVAEERPFWEREDVTLIYRDRRAWLVEVNAPGRVAIAIDGLSNIVEVESRQIRVQFEGREMGWEEANERFDGDHYSTGQLNELSFDKRNTNDGRGLGTAFGTSETRAPAAAVAAPTAPEVPAATLPAQPRDFRQEITEKMITALEAGDIPWKKPWRQGEPPMNALSGHRYRGINRFMTMLTMFERGYSDPRWLTFRQVQEIGGHVRKGERGVPIEVWKPRSFWERKDVKITLQGAKVRVFDEGPEAVAIGAAGYSKRLTTKAHPSSLTVEHNGKTLSWRAAHMELDSYTARVYTIFNVAQCDGLDFGKLKPLAEQGSAIDAHTRGEFLKAAMRADGVLFQEVGEGACYIPAADKIQTPPRDRFASQEAYYATVLHEIGHSTGGAHRLNRDGITGGHSFGSEGYAREELRAELASAFLSAETGIGLDRSGRGLKIEEQHKAYLQHWAKVLKSDKNEFFRAAKEAGEAADYVLARERELAHALENAGLTQRQAQALEGACAEHNLQCIAGVVDGPTGDLVRVECSAAGDVAFRDPATRVPVVTVPSRQEDLARAIGERYRLVHEEVFEEEAEDNLSR